MTKSKKKITLIPIDTHKHICKGDDVIIKLATHSDFSVESIKDLLVQSLDDDKAEDIIVIDLRGKTSLTDYMIITTGRSSRHLQSMARHLDEKLTPYKEIPVRIEGLEKCEWVLVDAGDIIVHLFLPEIRHFYDLEKIWSFEENINAEKISST